MLGPSVKKSILYAAKSPDLSSEVGSLKAVKPDAMLFASYASDAILMLKTLKAQKAQAKLQKETPAAADFSLSGAGREVNGSTVETWDGKWMIRKKTLTADWDTEGTEIELIDNRPTAGADVTSSETFNLNVSGGVVKLGFSIRF